MVRRPGPREDQLRLVLYGRGYTPADPSFNSLQCFLSGPSKPANSTDSEVIMSLSENQKLAKQRNIELEYLKESRMKQLTWDDHWIEYDDEEKIPAKKNFANS